jgi:glycosyltransferase involved in cell wall biosynthesis
MPYDITVVIPAFNGARFVAETLDSIRAQTLPARQIIVVDDGSTDSTGDIVREKFPEVLCVRVANGGAGVARRHGIELCTTDWVALCDSDDLWRADHLERKAGLIEAFPDVQLAFSDSYSFGPGAIEGHSLFSEGPQGWFGRFQGERHGDFFRLSDPYRALLAFAPIYVSGLAFRLDAYNRMGGFLPKYSRWVGEDSEFVRRFVSMPDVVVAGDHAQTWGYRRHGDNFSKIKWKNYYCKPRILKEHLDLGVVPERFRGEVDEEVARSLAEAFDMAYWDDSREGMREIYPQLPASVKTLKRRFKALMSVVRSKS